jgi:hypothetical protein
MMKGRRMFLEMVGFYYAARHNTLSELLMISATTKPGRCEEAKQ